MVDLSQLAIGRGQQTVDLIGPALCPAGAHSSVHQAAQAGQAPVTLTGHLTEGEQSEGLEGYVKQVWWCRWMDEIKQRNVPLWGFSRNCWPVKFLFFTLVPDDRKQANPGAPLSLALSV